MKNDVSNFVEVRILFFKAGSALFDKRMKSGCDWWFAVHTEPACHSQTPRYPRILKSDFIMFTTSLVD